MPSTSTMQPESNIYAQVNKRRDRTQEASPALPPRVKVEAVYANITPPVPRKNIGRKRVGSKSEWGRDMMTTDREVKALAQIRKPLPPRPKVLEIIQVPEQYVDKEICETTETYSNVSLEFKATPKQHPVSVGKETISKKPKPEPRSKLKPVGFDVYGNSANKLVSSRVSDTYIYEDALPVNPALVEGMPPRDTLVVDRTFYNYMWQVRPEDMKRIEEACFVVRGRPTRDPKSVELCFVGLNELSSGECKQRFAEMYNNLQESILTEQTAADEGSRSVCGTVAKITPAAYAVGNSFCLYMYAADITKLRVDVIVNAANENLFHGGGIAKAIADAAGPKLIKESEALAKRNQIGITDVVKTTSGNLPCKAILHAVGPRWPHTTDANMIDVCRKEVMDTYINIIDKANSDRYKSIAMPPISSGIFGVPGEIVIKALIDAILSSSVKWQRSKLKEIHIVDIKDDLLEMLARQLSERDLHRAPNGMQIAITEIPKAEIERAITSRGRSGIKEKRNKWMCGMDRRNKKK